MNKLERNQITVRKWHRRLRLYKIPISDAGQATAFKAQVRPCNCRVCQKPKYNRAKEKAANDKS
ncbi:hypothetical protein GO755_33345 [Spirosoma sp. HMF4905]|uniref:Uncharacterized protein n=1 Tax=Spirosoma arboris TaxID=2682092 RepID=A0A7K1SMD2_9BACT|nr:hypothetical protein [Spirosoma arboris]MVM34961.1 hypothetical protein [Spirosoma arboris]